MAIKIDKTKQNLDGEEILSFEIDNGEKKALEQIKTLWNFKDEGSVLRFMMSVLLRTEDKKLWIKTNGQPQGVSPVDDLLINSDDNTAQPAQ
jgi:hypothetical protein